MVEKTLWKVEITTMCGETVTADDATLEGLGTTAYEQIGHDFRFFDGTKHIFIPYHAVCKVEATPTATQVEYKDDNCEEA